MRYFDRYIIRLLIVLISSNASAQMAAVNFHKLGFPEGLHDGIIRCIAQDKLGYIWIGSVGAINRYNGKKITQFTHVPGDTTSPYSSQPRSMHSDKVGRFWIGSETGLSEYNFTTGRFKRVPAFKNVFITAIESINDSVLVVGTRKGLFRYNTKSNSIFDYASSTNIQHTVLKANNIYSIYFANGQLYLGTVQGLVILNVSTDAARKIMIPEIENSQVFSVNTDNNNNIWACTSGKIKLVKLSPDGTKLLSLKAYGETQNLEEMNTVAVVKDHKGDMWVITDGDGLLRFASSTSFVSKYQFDINFPSGPSSNSFRCIFKDASGLLWLGCSVEGVNYIEPGKNLFNTVLPFPVQKQVKTGRVGRAVTVDQQKNIWMGNHDGLSRYNPETKVYTIWNNENKGNPQLYNKIVRSLLCDDENNIWIGTASGVNKYISATGKMEFIDSKFLPLSFYNSINKDKSGNIWFCTTDSAGLYWYNASEKKFHNISEHPMLKKYKGLSTTSYVMEDSKKRLWISFTRKGVVMLDKNTGATKHYRAPEKGDKGIIGDLIIDIKEDKDGIIWFSTFNGISGLDVAANRFINFNNRNGLPGNMAAPLAIDNNNRIWAGVNGGLSVISADRKYVTLFSENDGLPSVGFSEHAGVVTDNGQIIMPSNNGYFLFTPEDFKEQKSKFNFYVSSCNVFDKEIIRVNEFAPEPVLQLNAAQNSFTFQLTALNYNNPSQTWFAYKLDGFEEEWHYTQNDRAVYTNVPGGDYTFLYKASGDNNSWDNIQPKKLTVQLSTYYYKTKWFFLSMGLLLAGLLFFLYRYRLHQKEKLLLLENKAQVLEKEKALVMYENLKQHLNPHFLFNSLTSLSSLIRIDQNMAGDFLDKMSKVYRYILRNRDNEVVPVSEEMTFVQLYIDLQKTRFGNGLQVTIDINEEYRHRKIAPVTLQNLVENAIKHNIADEESPLLIELFVENDNLVVRNKLQKKKFVETSNRQGLSNMESLYRYLCTRPLEIIENENFFIVKIPLI